MKTINLCISVLAILSICQHTYGQHQSSSASILEGKIIPLNDLSAFKDPGKNWRIVSDAWADFTKGNNFVQIKPGSGIVINQISKMDSSHLVTKQEFGDLELSLDFMMAKEANSGIYIQGRYEVQLLDSWKKMNPVFYDLGGIYQRWDESSLTEDKGFEGVAPRMNVAKAPGLWQHLLIRFRAPKFDENGVKIANARFEEVYVNGVLVVEHIQVTGPTRSSLFDDETPLGPIVVQGDHGNVALRNICYKSLPPSNVPTSSQNKELDTLSRTLINPEKTPYLLTSGLQVGKKKYAHAISVGNPNRTNFSYDPTLGAVLQFWRGQFMEATGMSPQSGKSQWARPVGAVIPLSDAPAIARLEQADLVWPESIPSGGTASRGYTLDRDGNPTFHYDYAGLQVADKMQEGPDGEGLRRTVKITGNTRNVYFRITSASSIEIQKNGLYAIAGKSYYIQVDRRLKPMVRNSAGKQELIVALRPKVSKLEYSIIW